jgi:transposase
VARPSKHPVDVKLKIVLSVLRGESTQAEAARRHGVSETSIGKWREQFVSAGRQGLEVGDRVGRLTGQEARLAEEIDDLTRALGEAHVELRALKRGGPAGMREYLQARGAARDTWKLTAWDEYTATVDLSLRPRCDHIVVDNRLNAATSLAEQARSLVARAR